MSADALGTPPSTSLTPPHADAPRRAVVLFFIAATAAIFVGLFAILYFRWAGAQEPSSVIMVATTPAFDGAEITVEGIALPRPYRAVVGAGYGKTIPFYLDRGSYTLRVHRDGKQIYSADFVVSTNQGHKLDLSQLEHLLPESTTADDVTPQTTLPPLPPPQPG